MITVSQEWEIRPIKTYEIKAIDYADKVEKIISGKNIKRDLKRFYIHYRQYLDADFVAYDRYSREIAITDDELDHGILKFNDIIVDLSDM